METELPWGSAITSPVPLTLTARMGPRLVRPFLKAGGEWRVESESGSGGIGLVRLRLFRRRNSLSTRTHVVYVDPRVGSVIVYDNPLHRLYTRNCYSSFSQTQVRSYDPDLRTVRSDYGSAPGIRVDPRHPQNVCSGVKGILLVQGNCWLIYFGSLCPFFARDCDILP